MPVSRFALYFLALAACSTIAFGSGFAGKAITNDHTSVLDAASERPFTAAELAGHSHHRFPPKMAQVARAG